MLTRWPLYILPHAVQRGGQAISNWEIGSDKSERTRSTTVRRQAVPRERAEFNDALGVGPFPASGRSKNFERGLGVKDNVSAPWSFVTNAHNELHAFYTGKNGFSIKILSQQGGGSPHRPPFISATDSGFYIGLTIGNFRTEKPLKSTSTKPTCETVPNTYTHECEITSTDRQLFIGV